MLWGVWVVGANKLTGTIWGNGKSCHVKVLDAEAIFNFHVQCLTIMKQKG